MAGATYLLDTNVVSELARARPDRAVTAFLEQSPRLKVSVMLFHELAFGMATIADPDRSARLAAYFQDMHARFGPAALPVTTEIAATAGQLRALAKLKGRILTVADSLMAATATDHGLTLVTRNIKDFHGLSVATLNPFSS